MLLRAITLVLCSAALVGCASSQNSLMINSIVIQNKARSVLTNVLLRVPKTGGTMSCNIIPPNGECALEFKSRKSQNNKVILSWQQKGRTYSKELMSSITHVEQSDGPKKLVVTIGEWGGIYSALLKN